MTALYCDPQALAGILRERQESYEFVARGTVGYYERTLDFGAWVAEKRSQCAHGVWMKTLRELGWSYSICNRAIKLHKLGVSAAELARDGAKAVLKRFARPRRPAAARETKFSAGAKFETPPGAGEADAHLAAPRPEATMTAPAEEPECASDGTFEDPAAEAWESVCESLKAEIGDKSFDAWIAGCRLEVHDGRVLLLARGRYQADRIRQEFGERIERLLEAEFPGVPVEYGVGKTAARLPQKPAPDDADSSSSLWPWPLDLKYSGDRVIRCLIAPEIQLPQARALLGVLAYWNFFGKDGKQKPASIHNHHLAELFGVELRTIQYWLEVCRRAGWLHSIPQRGTLPDRQYVWPNVPPGMSQRSMALPRTFDRLHQASAREAAESAVARPRDETGFIPEVKSASPRDEAGFAPEVKQGSSLNGNETERTTAADTPPAPAKRGRRAAG